LSFDYHAVVGDYQYRALHAGHPMQRFWHRGKLVMIDRLFRPHITQGSRILEIGCGAGNLLLQTAVPGSYPIGLDLSLQALEFVRSRLQETQSTPEAVAGFACIQSVGECLPFSGASFDAVILSEVVEHLEAPQMTMAEASRVLRPRGRLLVTTPNYRSFWPVMEWTVDLLGMAPKMGGEQHISRFFPSSLERLMCEAGLALEYFGTIYFLSPFMALASTQWAIRQLDSELQRRSNFGMILVAVGVKS
jgi:2-polyprenyl-3-methyl-5-hydroxy-6-metoxy-1,4-benzoquinol methylase